MTDTEQELEIYKTEHARILKEWYQESAQLHQQIMTLQKTSVYGLDVTRSIVTALVMFIRSEWEKRNTSEASRMYIKQSVNALRVIWGKPKNGC